MTEKKYKNRHFDSFESECLFFMSTFRDENSGLFFILIIVNLLKYIMKVKENVMIVMIIIIILIKVKIV